MKKRLLTYLTSFVAGWCLISLAFGFIAGDFLAKRPHSLPSKLAAYQANSGAYDLLFIGDSRTYCGIHPELIDPLLGTNSLNLSTWANWLPSQYLFVRALIPSIPKGTTVVWTLGKGNFSDDSFRDKFPMTFKDVVHFHRLGLPFRDIVNGYASHNPLLMLPLKRTPVFDRIDALTNRPLLQFAASAAPSAHEAHVYEPGIENAKPISQRSYPPEGVLEILSKNTMYNAGKLTSLDYKTKRGGSCRYELDHAFFRSKETFKSLSPQQAASYQPKPALESALQLLNETLQAFDNAGISLILNIIEDSPYTYFGDNKTVREKYRFFLENLISKAATSHGFPVVMADQSKFSDADYYDHNHLNFQGINKYSPALANVLKPHLSRP